MYQPHFNPLGIEYCKTSTLPASLQLAFWIGRWLIDISRGRTLSMAGVMRRILWQEIGTHGTLTMVRVSLKRWHISLMLLVNWLLQQSLTHRCLPALHADFLVCVSDSHFPLLLFFPSLSSCLLSVMLPESWITSLASDLASALGWHSELWHWQSLPQK